MTVTSAEAAKMLRKLNENYDNLINNENKSKDFLAAMGEDPETVRPKYNYSETQDNLNSLEEEIRKLKHAINVFNSTTVVPGFDMTIDSMLIFIPQLTRRKQKLGEMMSRLPKEREQGYGNRNSNIIDYRYTNYDVEKAAADFDECSDLLSKAQTALDVINTTVTFEI